jgi:hypothetical protein
MWPTWPHRKQTVDMSFVDWLFKSEALARPLPAEFFCGLAAAGEQRSCRPSNDFSPSMQD